MKKTKIVATLGPASQEDSTIRQMILNGVNVFRLNFSHGTHEYHKQNLEKIRQIAQNLGKNIGILQDISGPKIRVCSLNQPFNLKQNDIIDFYKINNTAKQIDDKHYQVSTNYHNAFNMVKIGQNIFLCDGSIKVCVSEIYDDFVRCVVCNEGILSSNKGINFPDTKINIDIVTQKDEKDIAFGIENDVDFMAISFVQNAHDVSKIRQMIEKNNKRIKIFSKIEKFDAVENIDEILRVSDGIMVARGDLGIEVPYFRVPSIQKQIIQKANLAAKPVITATQMLFSLTKNLVATRAEISDVANAVLDGTDAVMLSEESAVGIDPANAVNVMAQTIMEAEKMYYLKKQDENNCQNDCKYDKIINATANLAKTLNADTIICLTTSGTSARAFARTKVDKNIVVLSQNPKVLKELSVSWGLNDMACIKNCDNLDDLLTNAVKTLNQKGWLNKNHTYILTAGYPVGKQGSTNLIRILENEQLEYYLNKNN